MLSTDLHSYPQNFSFRNVLSILAVILVFFWSPLNLWYLHFDAGARTPFAFLLFAFLLNWREVKQTAFIAPTKLYTFLAIYMIINGYLMGGVHTYEKGGYWLIFIKIIDPVLVMLIILNVALKNIDKTLKILLYALLTYCLVATINSTLSEDGRLDAEINANEMALYGAITVGVILIMSLKGIIKKSLLYLVLPVFLTIQTGSRMGFAMILIIIFTYILLNVDFAKRSTWITFPLLILVAIYALNYILFETVLGERLLSTTEQFENIETTGTILDYYGDRGFQYYYSWPYFLENPIFGIGFHKWIDYNPRGYVCHSEFMVQYVECGLVAFIPWCIFWYLMIKPLHKARKISDGRDKKVIILILSILVTLLYADTVFWSYDQFSVFIMYALTLAYPKLITTNNNIYKKKLTIKSLLSECNKSIKIQSN